MSPGGQPSCPRVDIRVLPASPRVGHDACSTHEMRTAGVDPAAPEGSPQVQSPGQVILTIAAAMLASGVTLPFIVGSAISPLGYSVLQIGGLVGLAIGFPLRALGGGKRRSSSPR